MRSRARDLPRAGRALRDLQPRPASADQRRRSRRPPQPRRGRTARLSAKLVHGQIIDGRRRSPSAPDDTTVAELRLERFELLRHQAALQVESRTTHAADPPPAPAGARSAATRVLPDPSRGRHLLRPRGRPVRRRRTGASSTCGAGGPTDGAYDCVWAHDATPRSARALQSSSTASSSRARSITRICTSSTTPPHELSQAALAGAEVRRARGARSTTCCAPACSSTSTPSCARAPGRRGELLAEEARAPPRLRAPRAARARGRRLDRRLRDLARDRRRRRCSRRSAPTTRRTAARRPRCATGCWTTMRPEAARAVRRRLRRAREAEPTRRRTRPPKWLPDVLALIERAARGLSDAGEDDDARAGRAAPARATCCSTTTARASRSSGACFDLRGKTPVELVDERDALGPARARPSRRAAPRQESLDYGRSASRRRSYEAQAGRRRWIPTTGESAQRSSRVEDDHLVLRRGKNETPPAADSADRHERHRDAASCARRSASSPRALLAGDGSLPRRRWRMLRREPPRLRSGELGPDIDQLVVRDARARPLRAAGAGAAWHRQDYRGARMIVAALARRPARRRHRARATPRSRTCCATIEEYAHETGFTFQGVYKGDALREPARPDRRSRRTTQRPTTTTTSSSPARPGCSRARSTASSSHCSSSTRPASSRSPTRSPSRRCAAKRRAARRPAAAAAGQPGRAPRRRRRFGARAPARRARRRAARSRRAARRDLAHAPRRLRVRLRAQLRRTAALARRVRAAAHRRRRRASPAPACAASPSSTPSASQDSPEEAAAIAAACARSARGRHRDRRARRDPPAAGAPTSWSSRPTTSPSHGIRERVPDGVRVGTVDRFQGQRGAGRLLSR